MVTLERKRELRTAFMHWLYDQTGGSETEIVDADGFGETYSASASEIVDVVKYLEGEYLVNPLWTIGGLPAVSLTHSGVREIEDAITRPSQPTEHFLPMINITNILGNVTGSQIQQGSPSAAQTGTFMLTDDHRAQLLRFVTTAREVVPSLQLAPAAESEVTEDLTTLEREARRPQPRLTVLREVGRSVRAVVENAAGGVAASGVLSQFPDFL